MRNRILAAPLAATVLGGCVTGPVAVRRSPQQVRSKLGPVEIEVMTFNIWIGAAVVDRVQVPAAIRACGADIVGLQETEGDTRGSVDELGWRARERTVLPRRRNKRSAVLRSHS